jgi:hypothetical protein
MRITLEGDDRQTLIARLGLSSDASDADINAAVANRILASEPEPTPTPTPTPTPAPEPTPPPTNDPPAPVPADDDEAVVVDSAAYAALVARAGQADQLEETARVNRRDTLIAQAVRDGRFPPSRRKHYAARYDSDPEGTTAQIERMARNVVPVKERGVDASAEDLEAQSDAYPTEWLPEKQPPAAANGTAAPAVRQSRIHTED